MNDKESRRGPLSGKKIVLLAEFYSSGGTRTYLMQLLDFYAISGAEIDLVGLQRTPDHQVSQLLKQHGFRYRNYWTILSGKCDSEAKPPVWSPLFIRKERAAFHRYLLGTGADGIVVSAGTPGQFVGAAGAVDAGIYLLHTYPHGRRQERLGRFIIGPAIKKVGRVVAVSRFQQSEMNRLWKLEVDDGAFTVIVNTAGPPLLSERGQEASPCRVITASWVEPYKEPWEWLEVARRVSLIVGPQNVHFVWFGEGSMLDECRQAAEDIGPTRNVEFVGHVGKLSSAYREACVYLQLSSTENMSLSTIEALRYALPIVSTKAGGLSEISIDGQTGLLVAAHDIDAATDAVVSLIGDSGARQRMSAAAEARYATKFSLEGWLEAMTLLHLQLFERLDERVGREPPRGLEDGT